MEDITLSTGVVIRPKAVPVWLIQDQAKKFPVPGPPSRYDEDTGREVADEEDPEYLQKKAEMEAALVEANANALFLLGTEIVTVPKGFPAIEDTSWEEEINFLGISIAGIPRKVSWLRYYAVRSQSDLTTLSIAVLRATLVREEDVEEAMSSFRGAASRLPNLSAAVEEISSNGNNDAAPPARNRARIRRT